jgi:predicted transcriptional regulator
MKRSSAVPSVTHVIKKISDDKALTLFNSIATSNGHKGTDISLRDMNLSIKQYYSRLSGLMSAGLVRREDGKYSLTLIGKIVYHAYREICTALSCYWELKAINSIEMSTTGTGLSKEELRQLINTLIDNHFIKDLLIKEYCYMPLETVNNTISTK